VEKAARGYVTILRSDNEFSSVVMTAREHLFMQHSRARGVASDFLKLEAVLPASGAEAPFSWGFDVAAEAATHKAYLRDGF
jgi:hypothetical protein